MAQQKWLVALLVGSSIGCLCGESPSTAQSLTGLKWRLQTLPNLGGVSFPGSINNRDWISGDAQLPDNLFDHPALWRRTADSHSGNQSWRLTDLGNLGGPNAMASFPDKNEMGWLAGRSETTATDPYAENFCGWFCSASSGCPPITHVCQGFLWREQTNKMIALPPITSIYRCNSPFNGGCNSDAAAANNNGQIAGYAENGITSPNCAAPQAFLYEGVVWGLNASGAPFIQRRLPPITGDEISAAFALNDAGIVVGGSGGCAPPNTPASPPLRAVLWKDGSRPLILGNLGGSEAQAIAYAINDPGQVVGVSTLPPPNDSVFHAFLWQEGVGMKDLGSLRDDDVAVFPQDINNRGEVVGLSCGPSEPNPSGCDGFYWRNGMKRPIDLNAYLTQQTSLNIYGANGINDSGEIAVVAFDQKGDQLPAVLVPAQGEVMSQTSPSQNTAAVQQSVLTSNILQRLSPRLRGWMNAR
jgi:probable HAF family extracellular repeat protein